MEKFCLLKQSSEFKDLNEYLNDISESLTNSKVGLNTLNNLIHLN